MKKSVRTGFTLVELLIVIAVIGILSSMMMLSSTETVASAKAANIISDMTTIRTAALAYYADNAKGVAGAKDFNLKAATGDVMKYIDQSTLHDSNEYELINLFDGSAVYDVNGDEWYVWCKVTDDKVKEKLKSRAKGLNLLSTAEVSYWYMRNMAGTAVVPYSQEQRLYVGMRIY